VLTRPQMAARSRRSTWQSRGAWTLEEAASDKVRAILAREPKPYLDRHQREELKRIEASALAALA
jgi:trimethylamine:corrinoid methyltransferase-like protein